MRALEADARRASRSPARCRCPCAGRSRACATAPLQRAPSRACIATAIRTARAGGVGHAACGSLKKIIMPSPAKRSSVPSCASDQPAHRRVVLAQHGHHLLGLGGLGERGEAAQVEEDDGDLAPVALAADRRRRRPGSASASCGEKKRLSRPRRSSCAHAVRPRAARACGSRPASSARCRCDLVVQRLDRAAASARAPAARAG